MTPCRGPPSSTSPSRARYEVRLDVVTVGFTAYHPSREDPAALVFPHTVVDPGQEG